MTEPAGAGGGITICCRCAATPMAQLRGLAIMHKHTWLLVLQTKTISLLGR